MFVSKTLTTLRLIRISFLSIVNLSNKKVILQGKHNIESLNKSKSRRIRSDAIDDDLSEAEELNLLEALCRARSDMPYYADAVICLERKINGYKQQDIKKDIHTKEGLISLFEVITKLGEAHMKCHYCDVQTRIMYREVRDPTQWTLDRIDNDLPHSNSNTVVSCLSCNLKRRVTDFDKFEFTKRMVVIKKE